MRWQLLILVIVITLIVIFLIFTGETTTTKYITITVNNVKIKAEIADTTLKRTKGLMFRDSLGENEGMLFVFDKEARHSFWMMNVKFPLDIIWINSSGKVVYIKENTEPCRVNFTSYKPSENARYALEINGGRAEKFGIEVGTKLNFNL